jgi:hypothetical protein
MNRAVRRLSLAAALVGIAIVPAAGHAAGAVGKVVEEARQGGAPFEIVAPFASARGIRSVTADSATRGVLREGAVLTPSRGSLAALRRDQPATLALELPAAGGRVIVDLVKVDLFAPGFRATTSDGDVIPMRSLGAHYRGVVRGEAGSLASVSVFDHEIMGFASTAKHGFLVLGRMGGDNPRDRHVLYPAAAMIPAHAFKCGMGDNVSFDAATAEESLSYFDASHLGNVTEAAVSGNPIDIYIEIDYDIYQDKGTGAAGYLAGVFNQSATLYANETIPLRSSEIFVWTRRSPYKGNSSSQLLQGFQKSRTSFNGDLGHLVSYRGGGGIAAGFNGLCNANRSQSQCFSGISASYNNVPTYSWTVMVFTHEMGHLMGSRHTHACVWNGNNTQIDGCYTPEGTCAATPYPSNGGTIMSYCHLSGRPGINFNNGFGTQPSAVINSRHDAASCLTP